MTNSLRRYHRYVWQANLIVLPLLLVAAIVIRPENSNAIESRGSISLTFSPSKDTVTIDVRKSLAVPSCAVVVSRQDRVIVLGLIQGTGKYHFKIDPGITSISLVNKIDNDTLFTQTLK